MSLRDEAEKKLRSLGAEYEKNDNEETLKAVEHQALFLLNLDPARSAEAVALLREVLPTGPQPPSAAPTLELPHVQDAWIDSTKPKLATKFR